MPRFARPRHDAALITSYLRQLRDADRKARVAAASAAEGQIVSGTIRRAPAGHSLTQIPQPLQKSRSIS